MNIFNIINDILLTHNFLGFYQYKKIIQQALADIYNTRYITTRVIQECDITVDGVLMGFEIAYGTYYGGIDHYLLLILILNLQCTLCMLSHLIIVPLLILKYLHRYGITYSNN